MKLICVDKSAACGGEGPPTPTGLTGLMPSQTCIIYANTPSCLILLIIIPGKLDRS